MQIYNEKIFDLLQDRRRQNPLQLRDCGRGASSSVQVRGLSVFRVYSKEDVMSLLRKGLRNRATRATEFNQESSRSHTIVQLYVQIEETDEQGLTVLKRSTFSLVDLAGSEKWRSSLSRAGTANADAQREMTNINTSLHVLGNCVSALIEPHRKHIPFRDSVLTRLLQV
jgi:kinesin family protein 18/19